MFDKQQRKIKRSAKFVTILSKYGFQDLLVRLNIKEDVSLDGEISGYSIYEKVRLALEELGPTFVKLGQSFSNREDLLPQQLIDQLQLLQDNVQTLDLNISEIITEELGEENAKHFKEINQTPIAAASIAQVYKGILVNDIEVIIKVKRPTIDLVIADDILILKDLIELIDTFSDFAEQLNLKNAVLAFEKSLLEELSLENEKKNIQIFRENFKNNIETYVPIVFENLCSNRILTMEYIEGTKITDVSQLINKGINPTEISEIGYRLFVSQIFDFGFFHADPHAGNIMVNNNNQVVFIDFGAVGKIPKNDMPIFENLILAFMSKNSNKIVRILKKMALFYKIPNERKFENDVNEILSFVHNSALSDINVSDIIFKMKEVLKENRLVMPDYFYLLFKGISLMDGVGRKLNPELDVVKSLKPFTTRILLKRFNPEYFAKNGFKKIIDIVDNIEEIPNELRSIIRKFDENKLTVTTEIKNYNKIEQLLKSSIINIILGMFISANFISSAIFWHSKSTFLFIISIFITSILLIILTIRFIRR